MHPTKALKHGKPHPSGAVLPIVALALGAWMLVGCQAGAPPEPGVLDVRSFAADPSGYEGRLQVSVPPWSCP